MKKFLLLLIIFLLLTSCSTSSEPEKYYEPDLKIEIPNSEDFIVIKEWSFLLGGGSDIFFESKDGTQTQIGSTTTDDGYKPFKAGKYETTWGDNSVTFKYDFGSGNYWKSVTFTY